MICSDCNELIFKNEKTANGPSGIIHYDCFKNRASRGNEIDLISLYREINRLKKRVQDLEQISEKHARNIDFRIG